MPPFSSSSSSPSSSLAKALARGSSLLRSIFSPTQPHAQTSPIHTRPINPTKRSSAQVKSTGALALSMAALYSATVTKPTTASSPDDAAAKSHHVKGRHGQTVRFQNPHPSAGEHLSSFGMMKRIFSARGEMKFPPTADHQIPLVKPTFLPRFSSPSESSSSASSSLRATWLGHACYYLEFPSGLRVLFDPVFEACCSPAPVSWFGPRRYTPPPCQPADLPYIDAVVISHSHYDHLSLPTVKAIVARHPQVHFFVGLGLAKWFHATGIQNVTEMDWWEDAQLKLQPRGVASAASTTDGEGQREAGKKDQGEITATVSCLPAQHSSGRTGLDRDVTLWASWAVSSGGKSVFFGGDTGYRAVPSLPPTEDDYGPEHAHLPRNPDFARIGSLRGPFDLGLIPIGAYRPRWIFSFMHADPFDAVEIFKDTACKRAMAIHWGAWTLTPEPVDEPPRLLRKALQRSGMAEEGVFDVCALGESREF